ncbi:hypothetical protein M3J09_003208 [Ascochyta lentis]
MNALSFSDGSAPSIQTQRKGCLKVNTSLQPRLCFANPGPLGFGSFATTLMTLSLSMMGVGGVSNQGVFIANLCFLAGIGLLISAQWEMVRGNTFAYTVLAAFGDVLLWWLWCPSYAQDGYHRQLWRKDFRVLQCVRFISRSMVRI